MNDFAAVKLVSFSVLLSAVASDPQVSPGNFIWTGM